MEGGCAERNQLDEEVVGNREGVAEQPGHEIDVREATARACGGLIVLMICAPSKLAGFVSSRETHVLEHAKYTSSNLDLGYTPSSGGSALVSLCMEDF